MKGSGVAELVEENSDVLGVEKELGENVGVDAFEGNIGEVGFCKPDLLGGVVVLWSIGMFSFSALYFIESHHGSADAAFHGSSGGTSRSPGASTSSIAQQNAAISSPK